MTLTDLKLYLGITDSSQDDLLTILLNASISFVEKYIGRGVSSASRTEYFDGNAQLSIVLKHYPCSGLTLSSNTGTQTTPVWEVVDADSYYMNAQNGIIKLEFTTTRGLGNYKAVYTGGMNPTPYDLQLAILKLAGSYRNSKSNDGVNKESVGGDSIEFSVASVPPSVFETISLYRNVL